METVAERMACARALFALGDDAGAEAGLLDALRLDADNFEALNDLGALALRRGRRSAARRAHERALALRPDSVIACVNLGNVAMEEGAHEAARALYRRALDLAPGFAPAHRGLARIGDREGDAGASAHWRRAGEGGRSRRPARGIGPAVPVLLLTTARLGNMGVEPWLDDRLFDADVIEVEYFDAPLPGHAVVLNLIADADLCGDTLARAASLARRGRARVLNPPALVAATGRLELARRLRGVDGVRVADVAQRTKAEWLAEPSDFPLLLRAPGFHAGEHFVRVERAADLAHALAALPGETLIGMNALDARGPDGLHRKYRAMCIGGRWLALHLAVSEHWKVHYFSAGMETRPECRDEEKRFLDDIAGVLGPRAMRALDEIAGIVGLDCFGLDFALSKTGELLVFEANAAMSMLDPPAGEMFAYRRPALAAARAAARELVLGAARQAVR